MTSRRVTAKTLKDWLTDGQEIALLDVREEGALGRGHMFLAVNLPLSRLELSVGRLVPRQSTRIVLCDDGDGLSERASEILAASGYRQTWILDGGIKEWRTQGYEVFSGTYVLEHAFGHFITSRYGTPRVTAGDLMAKLEGGEAPVIIDTRPSVACRSSVFQPCYPACPGRSPWPVRLPSPLRNHWQGWSFIN